MKHLISKEHHPHLKKRAMLEMVGFGILLWLSIDQRELIGEAITAIRGGDALFIFLLFSTYWLLLPLTSISYRMLSEKKILLATTSLAQLAASGPGRIIPGGLGHISIAAVHLNKTGCKLSRSVIIAVANNVIGLIINSLIIGVAILVHPTLLDTISNNISVESVIVIAVSILTVFTLVQWLAHIHGTRKTVERVNKEWKNLFAHLLSNPHRLLIVVIVAAVITTGHMAMLLLSGEALSIHIAPSDAFIALGVGVLFGGAVPTPGGLGAVEAGTITALIVLGYDSTEAVSVALLFRAATYWQPLIPGVLSYLYLREKKLL